MTVSIGFMEGAGVLNKEYMSEPGADMKDSAGEFSNFTCGVEAAALSVQDAILCGQSGQG